MLPILNGEDEGKIQFKRALESLAIGVIYAHSLKDKGKDRKTIWLFSKKDSLPLWEIQG